MFRNVGISRLDGRNLSHTSNAPSGAYLAICQTIVNDGVTPANAGHKHSALAKFKDRLQFPLQVKRAYKGDKMDGGMDE